jgi:hypothetical protein
VSIHDEIVINAADINGRATGPDPSVRYLLEGRRRRLIVSNFPPDFLRATKGSVR